MIKLLFFALVLIFLTGCKHGPDVTICILDPANDALQCSKDGVGFSMPFKNADNYFAVSPDDFKKVLDYCKMTKQPLDFSYETNTTKLYQSK